MISLSIPCYRVICVKADLTVNSLCVWREMDVDLEQVPSQSGTAILDINDGKILKLTGDMDTETGRQQCEKLFRVMLVSALFQQTLLYGSLIRRTVVRRLEMNKYKEFLFPSLPIDLF